MFITTIFANTTNEEILKKLDKIEHNQELLKQEMKLRFEAVDKRFEMMNENFNKRFEDMNENFNKRFEDMNENFNKRFEAIDKRFEMINENFNKRFEAIDKRFEMLTNFMMALTAGIFGLIGFMMWDRRTVVEKAKREMENSKTKGVRA